MRANISAFLLQLSPAALPCLKTAAYIMQWPQDPQSRNGTTTNWSRNLPISISRIILLVGDKFLLNASLMVTRFGNLFLEGHQDWIEQCLANLANLLGWAFLICICTFFWKNFSHLNNIHFAWILCLVLLSHHLKGSDYQNYSTAATFSLAVFYSQACGFKFSTDHCSTTGKMFEKVKSVYLVWFFH